MASDQPRPRSRLQQALSRIGRALDPDAAVDRADVRALLKLIREGRERDDARAGEQAAALARVLARVDALARESAGGRRDLTRLREAVIKQRDRIAQVARVSAVDRRRTEAESRVVARLTRLARSPLPVIVGPWTGEVGFELLYWIPFLQWVRQTFPIDPGRLVVVSRGGVQSWYGHVAAQYEDVFAHETPAGFRDATEQRKKQRRWQPFDHEIVRRVLRHRGIRRAHLLHPTLMYALFFPFWRYEATVKHLESYTRFRRLSFPDETAVAPSLAALPTEFIAVRFYFSDCFPDTPANRAFAAQVIEGLAARTHVVLLNNDIVVDDHRDFVPRAQPRVHVLAADVAPDANLAIQTGIIRRARAFVGTYGGYSYLAPLAGVSSVAFYSRPTFQRSHLEVAERVFQRLGGAALMPVDVAGAGALASVLGGLPAPVAGGVPGTE